MKAIFFESLPYKSAFHVGSHHYAKYFLNDGWEILWISHPLSPLHFIMKEKKDFEVRLKGWREGPLKYGNLLYYSPFTLLPSGNKPVLKSSFFVKNSIKATIPSLKSVIFRNGFEKPQLIWLTNPIFYPAVERLEYRKMAVRIADDTSKFVNVSDSIRELELKAIEKADAVFIVARNLYEKMKSERKNIFHLPNGVDFEHFQKAVTEPDDLREVPKPRIIYVGSTEYWFDTDLVYKAAQELSDLHFVIIGPASENISKLKDLTNVHILGPRPYDLIPAYLKYSDVGIIPFKRISLVDSINPIKLFEYLAAGIPVVATKWKELEMMKPPAYLAENALEFIEFIKTALQERDRYRDARISFARQNSWKKRYESVLSSLGF